MQVVAAHPQRWIYILYNPECLPYQSGHKQGAQVPQV